MPGCCPPQAAPGSGNVHSLYRQAFEETGLKSLPACSVTAAERGDATAPAQAISAWHASAAEQRRRKEWLAIGLPHNSSHLFGRLPFGDAVRLAVLVGTGQMTWAEVDAALDAKIKLAITREYRGQDAQDPHEAWEEAKRTAEDEIWARYHAKCDAVFAEDTDAVSTDPWSREQLRARERILERLRGERDRALAALGRRMDPQMPSREMSAGRMELAVIARAQLAATERDALRKLDASRFVGSQSMADAIRHLAMPLVGIDPAA